MITRDKINSRKLFVALLTEFLSTALLIAGQIEAEHWVTVTLTIVGAYMAAQGFVDSKKSKPQVENYDDYWSRLE